MSALLLGVTFALSVLNTLLLLWLWKQQFGFSKRFKKKISDINMEREITDIFSHNLGEQDVHNLAFTLFKRVKSLYKIRAHSYSELVKELGHRHDMPEKLQQGLIDFFDNIILVSYREKSLSETDTLEIKRKIRMVLKMLPS